MAIIRDTIKEFGQQKLKEASTGFLTGALGGTIGGAIAKGLGGEPGAKSSGTQSAEGTDPVKNIVIAVRDLQSDLNSQSVTQKQIAGALQAQNLTLSSISDTMARVDRTLRQISDKLDKRSSLLPDINLGGPGGGPGGRSRGPSTTTGGAGRMGRLAGPAVAIAGGALEGYNEYQESGSLGRAAAVGTGTAAGGWAGGVAGMKAGAALGALGGPIGSVVGGAIGGIAGGIGGAYLGSTATRAVMGPADKTAAMAELARKEEIQKSKAASEIEREAITYNSRQIVFKADSIKFETTGGGSSAASAPTGAAPDGAPPSSMPPAPSSAAPSSAAPSSAPGGAPSAPSSSPSSGGGGGSAGGGRGGGAFAAKDLPPEAQGLLSAISAGESGGRYDIINYVGARGRSKYFEGSRHPFEGQKGYTASGRYQFLWSTWADEARKMGIDPREFTPENQDRAAWSHAQRVYAAKTRRNLAEDLKNPQMAGYVSQVLRSTWHGIKGGDFLSREIAKASGGGGAGAGGQIVASSAVPGGAAVPETPGAGRGRGRVSDADMPAAGAMAMEGKGLSPEVQAAAAQASIATRGRFLNQGQFGPNLPASSTAAPYTESAGSTMEGFMPPTAPEAAAVAAAAEPFKPSKEYAEQKLGPQAGAPVKKPKAAVTAPGVKSGPSTDEVRSLWERYNETQHPADFVRADNAMKAMQAAQAAAPVPAGRVVAKGGKKAAGKAADLGPASMYGESDSEYRSRIAAQEAAAAEGAPGYEGKAGKVLDYNLRQAKELEEQRKLDADAERLAALDRDDVEQGQPSRLVKDAELAAQIKEKGSLAAVRQAGGDAAMTTRNAMMGYGGPEAYREQQAAKAANARLAGEGAPGFEGAAGDLFTRELAMSAVRGAPDTASGADMGFGAGGADLNRITDGQAAMRMSADLDAYKMQQFEKTTNPAAAFGFEDQPPGAGGGPEMSSLQTESAVPSSEMLRSAFGEIPNLGYAM